RHPLAGGYWSVRLPASSRSSGRAAPRQGAVDAPRRASGVVPGTAGVLLLSGFDPELEAVLRRRQRAGREVVERARRVVGLVEIERSATALRQRNVKEAPGPVGLASARLVREHDEELLVAGGLEHRGEPPLAAGPRDHHR